MADYTPFPVRIEGVDFDHAGDINPPNQALGWATAGRTSLKAPRNGGVGDGTTDDSGHLATMDANAATDGLVGYVPRTAAGYAVAVSKTLASPLRLEGKLLLAAGVTLTLNGPFSADPIQVFGGAGTVVFPAGTTVRPEWFGGPLAAAVAALPAGGRVLVEGPATVPAATAIPANVALEVAPGGTINVTPSAAPAAPLAPALTQGAGGAVPLGLYEVATSYVGAGGESPRGTATGVEVTNAVAAPTAAPTLTAAGSGGTWTAGTATVLVTYTNATGETTPSPPASQAVAANGTLTVASPPAATGATGWNAYATTDGNAADARLQQAVGSPTALGTALTLAANPAASNVFLPTYPTASVASVAVASPAAATGATGWYAYVRAPDGGPFVRQQAAGSPTALGTALTIAAAPATTGAAPTPRVLHIGGAFRAAPVPVFAGGGTVGFGPSSVPEYLPQWWGAAGTTRQVGDAATTSGSATVTSATAAFAAADVGAAITVGTAAVGTVASVTSATAVVVSQAATATTAGRTLYVGPVATAGVQQAIDACSVSGGGTVRLLPGTYFLTIPADGAHRPGGGWEWLALFVASRVRLALDAGAKVVTTGYTLGGQARTLLFAATGVHHWEVTGGEWDGCDDTSDEQNDWVLAVHSAFDWRAHDMETHHFGGKSVVVWGDNDGPPNTLPPCRRFRLERLHVHHHSSNAIGLNYCADWAVTDCLLRDTTMLAGGECFINDHLVRGEFRGNTVLNYGLVGLDGSDLLCADNRIVAGNSGPSQYGICVGEGQTGDLSGASVPPANVVVRHNLIDVSSNPTIEAIQLRTAGNNVLIEGNTCLLHPSAPYGIRYFTSGAPYGTGNRCAGNVVTGQQLYSAEAISAWDGGLAVTGNTTDATVDVGAFSLVAGNRLAGQVAVIVGADSAVTGNVLEQTGASGGGTGGMVRVQGSRVAVSGNSVTDNVLANVVLVELTGAATDCVVAGNVLCRNTGAAGVLPYIQEAAGADKNLYVGNHLIGPTPGGVPFVQLVGAGSKVVDCSPYTPLGHGVAQPAVPASGTATANATGVDCTVTVSGGTVTAVALGGVATGLTGGTFRVPVGQTITPTYSVAPTWQWFGD